MTVTITENVVNYGKNVKGLYVTKINKDNILMNDGDNVLKYYYEPKPNSVVKSNPDWLGKTILNSHNNNGLNERFEYNFHKNLNTIRILLLGDSNTYGIYVNTSENYSEIIEDLLNDKKICGSEIKFEVINLGVYGYDMQYIVERFIRRGEKYNADLAILLFNPGNFEKINEIMLPVLYQLEEDGEKFFDSKKREYPASKKANDIIQEELGSDFIVNYQFKNLYKLAKLLDGKLLLFSYFDIHQYENNLNKFLSDNNRIKLVKLSINLWGNNNLALVDGHPSVHGHQLIAEKLLNELIGYINCK